MSNHRNRNAFRFVALSLAAAGVMTLVGCAGGHVDPSPAAMTYSQNQDEVANSLKMMSDTNFRGFWQDLGRVFYLERPSRLQGRAIPY
ncbi:MAG: hypothetical protein VYC34_01670 [Planctomycetota bacterium]|nr:hypothetical protein [Planctomycetota bacterium]